MSYRTVIQSSFQEYLQSEVDSPDERAEQERKYRLQLQRFPFNVVLKISYDELDFANRWCWQTMGPADGECNQHNSEYPACDRTEPHTHVGNWISRWITKTEYNFGFNEWFFTEAGQAERFIQNVENLNWGEHYKA